MADSLPTAGATPGAGHTITVGTRDRPVGLTVAGGGTAWFAAASAPVQTRAAAPNDDEPVATRAALSQAQATKKLTKQCQRLVRVTKASAIKKLSKADRKARTACLQKRRDLISASKKKPAPSTPSPTNPAPSATPAPTPTQPGTPVAPAPAPVPAPTPIPPETKPADVVCDQVKITASSGPSGFFFTATAGVLCLSDAGTLNVELQNIDTVDHNVGIQKVGDYGSWLPIITGVKPNATATKAYKPIQNYGLPTVSGSTDGTWELTCMIKDHGAMKFQIKLYPSKAAFIAAGGV